MKFWIDGVLVDATEASVSVRDHGFTVGDGVFEALRTVITREGDVVPFALDRHLARLQASARGMGMRQPDGDEVRDAVLAVCRANPELGARGLVRLTCTSGLGPLGSRRAAGRPTLVVAASEMGSWPPYATVAMSPWPRNERGPLAGLKTTSYAENVLALAAAEAMGADEALLLNLAGDVCEGTGSNVFLVLDSVVVTPPLSSGCLAGITRALLIEWAAEAGIAVEQRPIRSDESTKAQEILLTSSGRDVHPVERLLNVEGGTLWTGSVGPIGRELIDCFARRSAADANP